MNRFFYTMRLMLAGKLRLLTFSVFELLALLAILAFFIFMLKL